MARTTPDPRHAFVARFPRTLWVAINQAADGEGVTINEYIMQCCDEATRMTAEQRAAFKDDHRPVVKPGGGRKKPRRGKR